MRIVEVIGMYPAKHAAFKHSLPLNSASEMDEPNLSLLDLMYQALTRDGQVIVPAEFKTNFEQSDGRHHRSDEGMSDETLISPDSYH